MFDVQASFLQWWMTCLKEDCEVLRVLLLDLYKLDEKLVIASCFVPQRDRNAKMERHGL